MKALILAGGHATRLWPITRNRAKPLLPLGGRPLVDYLVAELEEVADDVIISTNEKFADDFSDYIEEHDRDCSIIVENQDSEEEKPGTLGAIIQIMENESIDDDLLVVGGDNYFGIDFAALAEFFHRVDGPVNAVYDIGEPEDATGFGVVDVEDDRIVGFEEKPETPPSSLISTALYLFPEESLSLFHRYEKHFSHTDVPEEEYLDEPGRLIEWGHSRTPMYAYPFSGDWFDIGTPDNYLEANRNVGRQTIEGDVTDSELGDSVFVMENASVRNSELENCIIFPGAEISDATLENTIVDREASLNGIRLSDSVVGEFSNIQ